MKELSYLDGFSGYGGFHLALENAGFKLGKCYFSEMDKHAIANYRYNFPNSIYAGLIQSVTADTIPELDIFTFGWPCQDNSIAGKRKGQSGGKRSALLTEAVRIINQFRPRHFIAENVTGLLSVNEGYDYISAVEFLAYLNENCPQYDIEMQLFNSVELLPQNRERLFFIGHLAGSGSPQVFPIQNGISQIDEKPIPLRPGTNIAPLLRCTMPEGARRDIESGHFIRDLTPIEYERLQGLPDNWTKYGNYDGVVKEISDSQRYKLCGNGVSEPIVRMIAQRLFDLNYANL